MSPAPAELSSIADALDELTRRIGTMADRLSNEGRNDVAFELFEVERSLSPAQRRLTRLITRK